ncbi:MAG: YabP/YqfC family sporulation protein [Ruminococcus sp.]|nr:YabP/YqfC family sporulation protein [Ruminococcus sp.]
MNKANARLGFVGKAKDLACLGSYVSITDNKSVLIENCRQICECNDIMAKVCAGDYYIEIWGSQLEVSDYSLGSVMIYGTIDSIKLISKSFRERQELK